MFIALLQTARRTRRSGFSLGHLGAFGLFLFAILDSSPLPTFGGPDILLAILCARHRDPWWEYALVAIAGSVIGAMITFRLARRAGMMYLHSKFGDGRLAGILRVFKRWGTGAIVASTAIPFPFPTSVFFAAAGASGYSRKRFFQVVLASRAFRYCLIALLADHYGRRFIRIFRHPGQYTGWLVFIGIIVLASIFGTILLNRHLSRQEEAERTTSATP